MRIEYTYTVNIVVDDGKVMEAWCDEAGPTDWPDYRDFESMALKSYHDYMEGMKEDAAEARAEHLRDRK